MLVSKFRENTVRKLHYGWLEYVAFTFFVFVTMSPYDQVIINFVDLSFHLLGGGALSKIGARSERKLQLRSLKLSQMSNAVVGSATRKPLSVIKNPFSFGSYGPLGLGNKTMSTIQCIESSILVISLLQACQNQPRFCSKV